MDRPVAHEGIRLKIVFAVRLDGSSPAEEFYDGLAASDQAKLLTTFVRLADEGKVMNKQKFKKIQDTDFFEFKSGQIRMPCYFRPGGLVVVTHGFRKKSDKIPANELERTENIRREDNQTELKAKDGKRRGQ